MPPRKNNHGARRSIPNLGTMVRIYHQVMSTPNEPNDIPAVAREFLFKLPLDE
jgi:hypothetical protein